MMGGEGGRRAEARVLVYTAASIDHPSNYSCWALDRALKTDTQIWLCLPPGIVLFALENLICLSW